MKYVFFHFFEVFFLKLPAIAILPTWSWLVFPLVLLVWSFPRRRGIVTCPVEGGMVTLCRAVGYGHPIQERECGHPVFGGGGVGHAGSWTPFPPWTESQTAVKTLKAKQLRTAYVVNRKYGNWSKVKTFSINPKDSQENNLKLVPFIVGLWNCKLRPQITGSTRKFHFTFIFTHVPYFSLVSLHYRGLDSGQDVLDGGYVV